MDKIQFNTFKGELKSWDDRELVIEHFISTEAQDSGGDIMLADGMKLRGHPVVLFQHGLDPKFGSEPIAKVLDIKVGEHKGRRGLIAKTKYYDGSHLTPPDNTGHRLYEKAKDGTMPNWSIGFNSTKEHPTKGGRIVEEWELHEYSQVAVGMNEEATTLAATAPELKFMIVNPLPEGFTDEKAFMEATAEITDINDVDELICENGECKLVKAESMKPFPNEHACRINDPGKFSKFRRQNGAREHEGKKYDVIYGQIKGSDKWDEQAYRYPKDSWSVEQASAHCKSHEGRFEAAKDLPNENDKALAAGNYKRAHKALRALHKQMLTDLKEFAEADNYEDEGTNKCAKDALEEFSDNAQHHVEKYIKCAQAMKAEDVWGDEESEDDEETKSYTTSHRELDKCMKCLVKNIRSHKGDKSVVPQHKAQEYLETHCKEATEPAKEFVKEWHKKCTEPELPPMETKPQDKTFKVSSGESVSSVPAGDATSNQKIKFYKPPVQVVSVRKPVIKVTSELVKELIASAQAGMKATIEAELRKAAGKVT